MVTSSIPGLQSLARPAVSHAESQPVVHQHLHGLRGILAISSILWVFFQTFVPTLVSGHTAGPVYQRAIRITLSPVLWNETLISSFFLTLSARAICIRFLQEPKAAAYAGSIIRRTIRMVIVVSLASAMVIGIFQGIGTSYVQTFGVTLPNTSVSAPRLPDDALTALNSIFDAFWVVRSYYYQALNDFWPSRTIWNVSLIYQQSWTVYFLMIILPYTRISWHRQFLTLFGLGSWWMNSWGYYCASALLLADYAINPELRKRMGNGLNVTKKLTVPHNVLPIMMITLGWSMKFLWTALPQHIDAELMLHPYLDLAENTSRAQFAAADPYPRLDNYLVIFGVLLMMETNSRLRDALSAKWLVFLGVRSLSMCTH